MDKVQSIDITLVKPSATNPRKSFDAPDEVDLKASIKGKGIIYPLAVRPVNGHYEIIDGERRYRAAKELQYREVPCIVMEVDEEQTRDAQLISHVQSKSIKPMEEAQAFVKLLEHSDVASVARAVGKSESYVARRKSLTSLIDPLAEAVTKGVLPVMHALELSRCSKETQEAIYAGKGDDDYYGRKLKTELSRGDIPPIKELKERIGNLARKLSAAKFDTLDASLVPAMGACAACRFNTVTNPGLFGDLGKEAICKNGKCFDEKTLAHVSRRIEAEPDLVKISTNYGRKSAGVLTADKYDRVAKGKVSAIIVEGDGDEIGRIVSVNLRGNAAESAKGGGNISHKLSKAELASRAKRKKEIYETRISQEARIRARALAVKGADQKTVLNILPVIAAMMAQAPIFTHYGKGAELRKLIAKMTGGEFPKAENPKAFQKKSVALNKLIVGMAVSFGQIEDPLVANEDDSYIEFICETMKIPYKALHATVRKEWEDAKKTKKSTA